MTALEQTTAGFTLHLSPTAKSVAMARSAVRRVVTFVDDETASGFLIALTEILSNAIDEHQRIGSTRAIIVEIVFGHEDRIMVTDEGRGFDPVAEVDTDDRGTTERGRGLALARAFVPGLTFDTGAHGTVATLPLERFGIVR